MTELAPLRDDRRPSLRKSVAIAACLVSLFGVVWLLLLDAATGGAEIRVGTVSSAPALTEVAVETPATAPSAPSELPARSTAAAGETEVCGGAWMSLEGDPEVIAARAGKLTEESANKTKALMLPAMMASADERTRAAALRFMVNAVGMANLDAPGCTTGAECDDAKRRWIGAKPSRDALASMAIGTSDPQVYAWALQACGTASPADYGACQMINVEQWARLDPDNAAAWQGVALQARARHDAAALDDAMYHVAMSSHHDEGWGVLTGQLLESLPAGEEHLLGAEGIFFEAIGIEAAEAVPLFQTALEYCSVKLLGDSNRREICSRIADNLLDHSTTLLGRQLGRTLLARMGGSVSRLQAATDQIDAFRALGSAQVEEPFALDCHTIERHLEYGRDLAQLGEVELARRVLAKSGKPVAELAAIGRARLEKIAARRAAELAASAAPLAASAPRLAAVR